MRKAGWGSQKGTSNWKENKYSKSSCCLLLLFSQSLGLKSSLCKTPMDCAPGSSHWGIISIYPPFQTFNPGIEPTSHWEDSYHWARVGIIWFLSIPTKLSEHSLNLEATGSLQSQNHCFVCVCVFFYRRSLFTLFSNLAGDQNSLVLIWKNILYCSSTLMSSYPLLTTHKGKVISSTCSLRNGTQSSYIQ